MAGAFYPPPPVFIGGAQPYAPPLGQAQSGPTPQPPPINGPLMAATFAVLLASWTPGPAPAQGSPQFVYPPAPVVASTPPAQTSAAFNAIRATWEPPFTAAYLQGAGEIAPLIPPAVAPLPPPPTGSRALALITDQWIDRSVTVIGLTQIGAVSANPPVGPGVPNSAPYLTIRATWDSSLTSAYYQGAGDIAPVLQAPTVQAQTPVSWANFWNIRSTWDAYTLPVQLFGGLDGIAPLLSAPAAVTQPATNPVPYQTIRQAWEPAFVLPPAAPQIATQPIVNTAPVVTAAPLANLVALNQPPPYAIPRAGTVASWLPPAGAPSQPQPVSFALLYSVIRSWDPPVWWPLPGLIFHPVSGPAATPPPPVGLVTQRLILDAWTPAALPVQPFQELDGIAPLIQTLAGPPPGSTALLRLLLQSWDLSVQPQQDIGFVYPLIATPSAPPPVSIANLRTLISAWDIWTNPVQSRAVVTKSGPVPQAPPVRTLINFRIPLEQWALQWNAQSSPPRNPVYVAPTLLGGPRYIVKRRALRLFDIVPDTRTFSIAHEPIRTFAVARDARGFSVRHRFVRYFKVSATTMLRFDDIEPGESWPLTFDFTPDLATGETLASIVSVTWATIVGTDASPQSQLNGSAALDPTSKKVIVPVKASVFNGNDYQITVTTTTTNAQKGPILVGVLPVRL